MATTKNGPSTVVPGTNATYSISVKNNGPSDAAGATMTDPLPAGTTFISETHPGGWTCTDPAPGANGTVSCSDGSSFVSGATAAFSIVVHVSPSASGSISNTATSGSSATDNTPGNNSSTATTTVGCTHNITGPQSGSLVLNGGSWCVTAASVPGSVSIGAGTTVVITGSRIGGSISANNGAAFSLCTTRVVGSVRIAGASGFVLIGDPGDDVCAGNTIASVVLMNNHGGLEFGANTVSNGVSITGNSGSGPFAEDSAPEVEANTITANLVCSGNTPTITNGGQPNHVGGTRSSQCAAPF
jgi:uncharacterized repeat protein (TIGR01451 family)